MIVGEGTIPPLSITYYSDVFVPYKVRKSHQGPSCFKSFESFRFSGEISLVWYFTECPVRFFTDYCIAVMVAAYDWQYSH